jgi:hypothetical protein
MSIVSVFFDDLARNSARRDRIRNIFLCIVKCIITEDEITIP